MLMRPSFPLYMSQHRTRASFNGVTVRNTIGDGARGVSFACNLEKDLTINDETQNRSQRWLLVIMNASHFFLASISIYHVVEYHTLSAISPTAVRVDDSSVTMV